MSTLTSAFLGIPVPAIFHANLKKLQITVKKLLPHVDFSPIPSAHITLFYLGDIQEENVDMVMNIAKNNLELLKASTVCMQGLGHFGDPTPNHIFVHANTQPAVSEYTQQLHDALNAKDMFVKSLPFKPHVTIGLLADESSQTEYRFHKDYLTRLLAGLKLSFPITEVALFARQDQLGKKLSHHTQIATLAVV